MNDEGRKLWDLYADGVSDEEISKRTGLTIRQVRTRLQRVRGPATRSGRLPSTPGERAKIQRDQEPFEHYAG